MSFFRSRKAEPPPAPWGLDQPLLQLTAKDTWQLRDAFEGVHIFGAIGSGKTSGSGQAIAKSYLASGFGGLVLTVKHDEVDLWRHYAKATGTEDRLVIFSPDSPYRFNFLEYEYKRPGGGQTENLVDLFYSLLETIEGGSNHSADSYWERSLKQLLRNAIDLVSIAENSVTLPALKEIVISAPSSPEAVEDPAWQAKSYCFDCMLRGEARIQEPDFPEMRKSDFAESCRYWLKEYAGLSDRTRSIIASSFTSMVDSFLRGQMRELFCTGSTLYPEMSQEGKVIILDLPIKKWGQIGRYAQLLFKYIWQGAIERRTGKDLERPVFLWADEAQFFLSGRDIDFQTTARSSRASTVYLTQNRSNYNAMLKSHDKVSAFLGSLNTKIFHSNSDPVTNDWAADMIARSWQSRTSVNSAQDKEEKDKHNFSVSHSLEHDVIPQVFTKFMNGGSRNNRQVEAIFFQGGRKWSTGKTFLKIVFIQELS